MSNEIKRGHMSDTTLEEIWVSNNIYTLLGQQNKMGYPKSTTIDATWETYNGGLRIHDTVSLFR